MKVLKIVLIFRNSNSGGFSIEKVFSILANSFKNEKIEVIEFKLSSLLFIFSDLIKLKKINADIYHITGHVTYFAPLLNKKKTIITIHDIGHYLYHLKGWRKFIYKWVWILIPIKKSSITTVVSEHTKNDLVLKLNIPEHKIKIVDNCYNKKYLYAPKKFNKVRSRILQIGTGTNKNILNLIQALYGIPCHLILVGKINEIIIKQLHFYKISYENIFDISDNEIHEQYLLSDFVSFVSTSEGFGLPIIEAQAIGRPVITSNFPPMSVVSGGFAFHVDPFDVNSIKKGIEQLITNDDLRLSYIINGVINVKRYNPKLISLEYFKIYKSVHEKNK